MESSELCVYVCVSNCVCCGVVSIYKDFERSRRQYGVSELVKADVGWCVHCGGGLAEGKLVCVWLFS